MSYCILKEGNDENSEKIITSLSKKLPDSMVPSEIIFLEDFPLLPNSKIDKKALMNIEFAGERNEIILPNTATQKIIVKIFTDLLQLDKEISIKDTGNKADLQNSRFIQY